MEIGIRGEHSRERVGDDRFLSFEDVEGEDEFFTVGGFFGIESVCRGELAPEIRDKIRAQIDLGAKLVLFEGVENVVPRALGFDEFVEERTDIVEGRERVEVHEGVSRRVLVNPLRRIEGLDVGEGEHSERLGRLFGDVRLHAVDAFVGIFSKVNCSADALDSRETLVGENDEGGLPLKLFRRNERTNRFSGKERISEESNLWGGGVF